MSFMEEVEPLGRWRDRAECKSMHPDEFFPESGKASDAAYKACSECRVKRDCLDYALTDTWIKGMWAGTNEAERSKIRRGRLKKEVALALSANAPNTGTMKPGRQHCLNCGEAFFPTNQTGVQKYCGKGCQQSRNRRKARQDRAGGRA